jgi:hypothetical protein
MNLCTADGAVLLVTPTWARPVCRTKYAKIANIANIMLFPAAVTRLPGRFLWLVNANFVARHLCVASFLE